jgi:hypothetical protein
MPRPSVERSIRAGETQGSYVKQAMTGQMLV